MPHTKKIPDILSWEALSATLTQELCQSSPQRVDKDPFEKLAKYERFLKNMTRF